MSFFVKIELTNLTTPFILYKSVKMHEQYSRSCVLILMLFF